MEGKRKPVSWPSIVRSGQRKLGLELDGAMDSREALGGQGSFSRHPPKETHAMQASKSERDKVPDLEKPASPNGTVAPKVKKVAPIDG